MEEIWLPDDSGEEDKASEKQRFSEGEFLQAMFCAAVSILVYTTAVPKTLSFHHRHIKEGYMGKREGRWGTQPE